MNACLRLVDFDVPMALTQVTEVEDMMTTITNELCSFRISKQRTLLWIHQRSAAFSHVVLANLNQRTTPIALVLAATSRRKASVMRGLLAPAVDAPF
jgi:hypothetical protein